jgi:hypothetical protein
MKRKWQVGDVEDKTIDESVANSLERIRTAFLNKKTWDEVMVKRQKAIERQRDRLVDSKPCGGFSFSTLHYPPVLLELLFECGGVLEASNIHFICIYGENGAILTRTNLNSIVREKKGNWTFKGSCFGCETLKDICWNAVKDYFIVIKVSFGYTISPTHFHPEIGSMVGAIGHILL